MLCKMIFSLSISNFSLQNNVVQGVLIGSFIYNIRGNINTTLNALRLAKTLVFFSKHVNIYSIFQKQIQIGFNLLCLVPAVSRETNKQLDDTRNTLKSEMNKYNIEIVDLLTRKIPISVMPHNSVEPHYILESLKRMRNWEDEKINRSKISGTIYSRDKDKITELINQVFSMYYKTNPLHPDIFPSLRSIETWIIRYTLRLYNAPLGSKASITSGGTESIFLACKAYRDFYKKAYPEIIVPITAHPAFDKACDCLGIKLRKVPIEYNTSGGSSKLDLSYYRSLINENTILLVGSAPSFPHGEIDPMREICKIAESYKLPVHMDACLGGFILPFLNSYSGIEDRYDFSMSGITSISADFHKYGLTEKGISIVMYNNEKYINSQYFVYPDWCGGIYATNTLLGSRPGSIMAITWATILCRGYSYYKELANEIVMSTRYLAIELSKIKNISVIGHLELLTNVVAFTTKDFDIYTLNDELKQKGWNLNPLQFPSSLHLCITEANCSRDNLDVFIRDVKMAFEKCSVEYDGVAPEDGGSIYGTSQKITNRSLVSSVAKMYLDSLYFS